MWWKILLIWVAGSLIVYIVMYSCVSAGQKADKNTEKWVQKKKIRKR